MPVLINKPVARHKTYEKRRKALRTIRKDSSADNTEKAKTWCAMIADLSVKAVDKETPQFCFCNNVFIVSFMHTLQMSDMTLLRKTITQLDEWKTFESENEITRKLAMFDEMLKEILSEGTIKYRRLKRTCQVQEVNSVEYFGSTFNTKFSLNDQVISTIFHGLLDIKRQCDFRRTALHAAVQIGWAQLCTVLLERGADIDAVDIMGRTPLHLAASADNQEISKLLLDHGSDVNKEDNFDNFACTLALKSNKKDVFELTKPKNFDINSIKKYTGKTLLCQSAIKGNVDGVRILLDLGADPTVKSTDSILPATAALVNLHEECFELLVTPDIVNEVYLNKILLEHAVNNGLSKCVNLLLQHGATVDTSAEGEYCHPLIVLVLECLSKQYEFTLYQKKQELFGKFKDIIAVLMKHGAKFSENSSKGPLLYQYMHSQATFDLLLELGADPHVVDSENKNLLTKSIELDKSARQTPLRTGVLIKANIDVTKMARQELNNTTVAMSALEVKNSFLHRMLATAGVDFSHFHKYPNDANIKKILLELNAVNENTDELEFQVPSLQQCAELSALRLFGQGHCVKSQIEQALLPSRFRSALLKRVLLE